MGVDKSNSSSPLRRASKKNRPASQAKAEAEPRLSTKLKLLKRLTVIGMNKLPKSTHSSSRSVPAQISIVRPGAREATQQTGSCSSNSFFGGGIERGSAVGAVLGLRAGRCSGCVSRQVRSRDFTAKYSNSQPSQ